MDQPFSFSADPFSSMPIPHIRDGIVVIFSEDTHAAEGVLSHLVQALEHASDQAAAHEYLAQPLGVKILIIPNSVVLPVKVLPEVRDGHYVCFLIGACSRPFSHQNFHWGDEQKDLRIRL